MISRRDFLVATAAGVAGAMVLPKVMGQAAGAKKLNVLFIIVDDLRPQLGCYGDKAAITPNIDKLAARGIRFERAYVQQAVCSPSRTSMLTGCRPDTTKIYDLQTHFRTTIPNVVTLPQLFKQNGWHAQGMGKIYHNGLDDEASWSVPHWMPGAGTYALKENIELVKSKRAKANEQNLKGDNLRRATLGPPTECADVSDETYADGQIAEHAIKVLGELKDKPFFMMVGLHKPHLPFVAPKKYWDMYKREKIKLADNPFLPKDAPSYASNNSGELRSYDGMPKGEAAVKDEDAKTLIHGYYAATTYMDAQLGKVIAELDRLGLRENTMIVMVGDHGWKLGEHGLWAKHTNFELDTHAPMIVAMPGNKNAGKSCPAFTEFVDLYPTVCAVAGVTPPKDLEGTSFTPLLEDPSRAWKPAAFSQYPRPGKIMGYSMRTDRYRLTLWMDENKEVKATELYDHQADEPENVNLANKPENAALVKQLTEQFHRGWKGNLPPGA